MQKLTDKELLAEIDSIKPLIEACEQSPDTRRILTELDKGRRRLLGEHIDSVAQQLEERGCNLAYLVGCSEIGNRVISIGHELVDRECRAAINREELPQMFGKVRSSNDFSGLYHNLRHWSEAELFEVLYPVATDCISYPWPAYDVAAELLINLDPRCPLTCREALLQLGHANVEASTRSIPFYLITQFGRYNVLEEAKRLLVEPGVSEQARRNICAVRYWFNLAPSELIQIHIKGRKYEQAISNEGS